MNSSRDPFGGGDTFDEPAVVANYVYRPPYPELLLQRLQEVSPAHELLVDIGCGPGKLALGLAPAFREVIGIDRSPAMVAAARQANPFDHVHFECDSVETADLPEHKASIVTAGASIHWMNHKALFTSLARCVAPEYVIAIVEGDTPRDPPWQAAFTSFLARWVPRLTGSPFDPLPTGEFSRRMNAYKEWLIIDQETTFTSGFIVQPVHEFIACQHSRDTFAPSRMRGNLAAFDQELEALLTPFTTNGVIEFQVATSLTIGTIR